MPLIETVTYPDFINPQEVKQGCDYIRFLNRSTGKVRTGIGAGRQDVNVSCRGGHRVEIKGVSHTKWIPKLSHNEAFRQWALLNIKVKLNNKIPNPNLWKISSQVADIAKLKLNESIENLIGENQKIVIVNLPQFKGILSHFVQDGLCFASEISQRLRVIACLNQPNMTHSEALNPRLNDAEWENISKLLNAGNDDSQILFWAQDEDIKTALETIQERCIMAFSGVPGETRKCFENGSTIFERVLPGADRMYPDTDSAPIPLESKYIENLRKKIPSDIIDRYRDLKQVGVPEDVFTYIFSKNQYPIIKQIVDELGLSARFIACFFGCTLKFIENRYKSSDNFNYKIIYDLFKYLKDNNLEKDLAKPMLIVLFQHPKMDFDSILITINFKRISKDKILDQIPFLIEKFNQEKRVDTKENQENWIMGQMRKTAFGNINLAYLKSKINKL